MTVKKIKKDIYCIGAIDWDRRLFDELVPLPDGTSYNSYLIKGSEKTVLLDTVDPAETRLKLIRAFEALETKHVDNPARKHGNIPL